MEYCIYYKNWWNYSGVAGYQVVNDLSFRQKIQENQAENQTWHLNYNY